MRTALIVIAMIAVLPIGLSPAAAQQSERTAVDAAQGEKLYRARCGACHSLDANRAGPMHRGVFGRKAGSVQGYRYSPAVGSSDVVWNEHALDRWLTDPGTVIPGQKMGFRLRSADQRRAIIAYLKRESRP